MATMRFPDLLFPIRFLQRQQPSIEYQKIDMPSVEVAKQLLREKFPNKLLTFVEHPKLQYTVRAKVDVYEGAVYLGRAILKEVSGEYIWYVII